MWLIATSRREARRQFCTNTQISWLCAFVNLSMALDFVSRPCHIEPCDNWGVHKAVIRVRTKCYLFPGVSEWFTSKQ